MADARTTTVADLVLSGGGVKGIGLAGAVVALKDAGYSVKRVSGVSAGSVVGSILAAASNGDQLTAEEIKELALGLPYHKFRDAGPLERIPLLGQAWGLLRETGLYRGDFAHDWVRSELKNLDVTTGQLVRLPWDYRRVYGLDPDEQPVADAVRASMAIPFYFRPVTLTGAD